MVEAAASWAKGPGSNLAHSLLIVRGVRERKTFRTCWSKLVQCQRIQKNNGGKNTGAIPCFNSLDTIYENGKQSGQVESRSPDHCRGRETNPRRCFRRTGVRPLVFGWWLRSTTCSNSGPVLELYLLVDLYDSHTILAYYIMYSTTPTYCTRIVCYVMLVKYIILV